MSFNVIIMNIIVMAGLSCLNCSQTCSPYLY